MLSFLTSILQLSITQPNLVAINILLYIFNIFYY